MIYDSLENIGRYKGMNPYLDEAIAFLEKTDLHTLPMGKTKINQDHVFVNVMEAHAHSEEDGFYEVHKKYMDIQIDLEGTEAVLLMPYCSGQITEFDETRDFGKAKGTGTAKCVLGKRRFVICMALEPHMPGVQVTGDSFLKKCVLKVETA